MNDITILIPTLNEEETISLTIDTIQKLYPGINLLIIDDGSKDKTKEIVISKKINLIDRSDCDTKGLTASILHGVENLNTSKFIVMDADLQHPPATIKGIYEKLNHYELVIGSRVTYPKDWGIYRKTQSRIANFVARIKLKNNGLCIEDPMSGFFGAKTSLIINLISKHKKRFVNQGFKVLLDILKILPRNTKIATVYYHFQIRKLGKSKISIKHVKYFVKSVLSIC